MKIDIHSAHPWPSDALSNFAPHAFVFRGVPCASMEGFLQSLKFSDPAEQRAVCTLAGKPAKAKGSLKREWQATQRLWWQGEALDRHGPAYQALIDEAYEALFAQNPQARAALAATCGKALTHSIGEKDPARTVLTESSRLMRLRQGLCP
jgi:predicted NAD-dependent protein-ADP-ribosyltransferase YbiA (DUF1768 family)